MKNSKSFLKINEKMSDSSSKGSDFLNQSILCHSNPFCLNSDIVCNE